MAGATQAAGSGALVERLEARRDEIEQAILTRVWAVEDTSGVGDPEYVLGLRAAVGAAVSYGLAALGSPHAPSGAVPQELLSQVRRAAHSGVGLHTVLRRCVAGHALLDDFIIQEADAIGGEGQVPKQGVLRAEAVVLDRLMETVASEYNREVEARSHSRHRRRGECVRRLLAGELADSGELHYGLDGWHVGAIARGIEAPGVLRDMAQELDLRTLLVPGADGSTWAWLGSIATRPDLGRLRRIVTASRRAGASFAFGEPGRDAEGWRLTHRQAMAAMPIAIRDPSGVVGYGDVALLAAAIRDQVLAESLRQTYLIPLEAESDGGRTLRQTLRAYLAAGRNVSSAAAALGVSRQTVKKRVCIAEERIGQPLGTRAAEIETALRLPRLDPA